MPKHERHSDGRSARVVSSVLEEISQTKPFPSKGAEAVVALLRTTDMLKRFFSGIVDPYGVTSQQYNVLRILRGAGRDGLPTLDIGSRMIEQTPGVTRIVDRLEIKGWVRRERGATDRRKVICYLTEAGTKLLSDLDQPIADGDIAALSDLSEDDTEALLRILAEFRAGLREKLPP